MLATIATAAMLNIAGSLLGGDRVTTTMTAYIFPSVSAESASPRTAIAYLCSLPASFVKNSVGNRVTLSLSYTHAVTGAVLVTPATVHEGAALDYTFAYKVVAA